MRVRRAKLLATFFYIGDMPMAPGSLASLAAGFLAVIFSPWPVFYIALFIVILMTGFFVSGQVERNLKEKDPPCVVIDEVSGGLIAFFMLPVRFDVFLTTFFLFRAFDMFKIYPVNKLEEREGSLGIMGDDLIAGLYTNLVMQAAVRLAGII